jgi:hypothetical protein
LGVKKTKRRDAIASIDPIRIYNACGKFSLHESADLVKQAKLVISHDTGLQYIACAFNKKVLAIWGGTSPKLAVEPYYGAQQLALHKNQVAYHNFIVPDLSVNLVVITAKKNAPKGILTVCSYKIPLTLLQWQCSGFNNYKVFKTSFMLLTASALLLNAACSSSFNLRSMIFSQPFFPIVTGTPKQISF